MASIRRLVGASRFAALALVFAALASVIIAFALQGMRADALAIATVHVSDMATILAEDVANTAAASDVALRDASLIVNGLAQGRSITPADGEAIRSALASRRQAVNGADIVGVANENGDVVASARGQRVVNLNVSDREYFTRLRDDREEGLYVSRPLRSKTTGAWTMVFARRIETPGGRFLGIAYTEVAPAALLRPHPDMSATGSLTLSLFYSDSTVVARQPNAGMWTGEIMPENAAWKEAAARGGGLYHSPGVLDAYPKYVAVRRVAGYPLFVNVAITDQAALATWRTRIMTIIAGGAIVIALIVALLYSQLRLADRLSRSRIRSWMRGKRLAANAAELLNTRKRFGLTLDYISQGMAMFDANEKLVFANRCYAELYGLQADQLRAGMDVREILALRIANGAYARETPADALNVVDEPHNPARLDHLQNGRVIFVREKKTDEGGWVTVQEDATERARAAQELAHAALHDSLTQLPNRQAFKNHLSACLAKQPADPIAILLVDIDGFKEVNDTYGHEVGDDVLIEVARRLTVEAGDCFVARLGGDEFAAVLSSPRLDAAGASRVAERLIAAIRRTLEIGGRLIPLGLCVGVNVLEGEEREFSSIMRRADLALYAAKNGGRNCVRHFDAEMEREYRDRVQLAQDLREAIERDQLTVHYQPIVTAAGAKIVCMEALARWRHPVQGPVSPATFVPIAEELGLIVALGNSVLRRACIDAAAWGPDVVVAVNVSSLQIERPDFVETVMAVVGETGLAPHRLQIEITESILLRNSEATSLALRRLRAHGVTFALDDFGTGFGSLAYLKSFPLDKVKIDKSFVDDICLNKQSIAIVGAIVALARGLEVETTAEGVETQDQYDVLRGLGVTTMQGYFFGRPKPIEDLRPGAPPRAGADLAVEAA
jgi:diguanylate cyclase (GGDEF)-like protein